MIQETRRETTGGGLVKLVATDDSCACLFALE